MHIIIGFLTAVGTILYFLDKAGIDIGWLNPWAWKHRRQWKQKLQANPAYSLASPMEAIALLMAATAKVDGDISSEEKSALLAAFERTFSLSADQAAELLGGSVFLLNSSFDIYDRAEDVLATSREQFTAAQKSSSIALLRELAELGNGPSSRQQKLIADVEAALNPNQVQEKW